MEIPVVRVSRLSPTIIQNGLQFIHKVMHVLELTIHRRKAYKRYLVEISQGTEDEFADQARRNFSFAIFIDGRFDVTNEQINLFRTDGAFVAGFLHSRADLFPIKGNSSAILLDHTDGRLFNLFIRRKSTLTAEAFATSTNRKVLTISRVNNFGFVVFTIGTSHRNCPEGAGSVARIALVQPQENIRDRKAVLYATVQVLFQVTSGSEELRTRFSALDRDGNRFELRLTELTNAGCVELRLCKGFCQKACCWRHWSPFAIELQQAA